VSRAVLAILALSLAPLAAAEDDDVSSPRGPFEWRETWLLAQPRLTLPAVSPDTLGRGVTVTRVDFDWGNDFGWRQSSPGEMPIDRQFLVDGEHRSLGLEIRHGLGDRFDLGLRVPIEWRGGGILDGLIDWFHGFTRSLGLPDNERRSFLTDVLRVDTRDDQGRPLSWDPSAGAGLGRIELLGRWALVTSRPDAGGRLSLVTRLAFPTPGGPFEESGFALGVQLAAAHSLGRAWGLYGGLGGTFEDTDRRGDMRYERARANGFLAADRRLGRRWSIVAQTAATSRLVTNVSGYPGLQWYLSLGARLNLDSGTTLEAGFTENLASQQATTDFGIQMSLSRRFGWKRPSP
jgi:uncharacterized protein DUF3187